MHTIYVGTYVHSALLGGESGFAGRAQGAYALSFDAGTGALTLARTYENMPNAAYLAVGADGQRLLAIHELNSFRGEAGGGLTVHRIMPDGSLREMAASATRGDTPCHIALLSGGDVVVAANYGGGSLYACRVDAQGQILTPQVLPQNGNGPNAQRQEALHMHSTLPAKDGRHVLAMDLGSDRITAYALAPEGAPLRVHPAGVMQTFAGDGPRMAQYHPHLQKLYVLCELSCRILMYACDDRGIPTRLESYVPTYPQTEATPDATAADLRFAPDGRYLYVSTRGHDSLTVFAVEPVTGALHPVQNIPCGGQTPRAFTLSPCGRWLLCANQDSDTVAVFSIDEANGTLRKQDAIKLPSPTCLVFAPDAMRLPSCHPPGSFEKRSACGYRPG